MRTTDPVPAPGFDARFVPHLRAVEDRHFWFRARNAVIGGLVQQIEPHLPAGYRVLEIGCGTGNTLQVLQRLCRRGRVLGLDLQREGFPHARKRAACPLLQADICRAPFSPDVRFDLIGMFDVLEHVDDDDGVLRALRAQLAPEGRLLLTVPSAPALWSAFDVAAQHRRRYTPDLLAARLRTAGFRVDYLSPFMLSLYPLAWMSRRLRPARTTDEAVLRDLRIVPGVNGLLEWLLTLEVRLLTARRRFPAGTSLVAIARI